MNQNNQINTNQKLDLIISLMGQFNTRLKRLEDKLLDTTINQYFNEDLDDLEYDDDLSTPPVSPREETPDQELIDMMVELDELDKDYFGYEPYNPPPQSNQLLLTNFPHNEEDDDDDVEVEIDDDPIILPVEPTQPTQPKERYIPTDIWNIIKEYAVPPKRLKPQVNMRMTSPNTNDYLQIERITPKQIQYSYNRMGVFVNTSNTLSYGKRKKIKRDEGGIYIQHYTRGEKYYLTDKPLEYNTDRIKDYGGERVYWKETYEGDEDDMNHHSHYHINPKYI